MGGFTRASSCLLWLAVIALCSEAAFGRVLETLNCTQSSVAYDGHCGRALDGNTARNYARKSCTHTGKQARPWWQVTLKTVSRVRAVRIFNRGDCCAERLNNFVVQVDGRTCAVHKSAKPFDVKKLTCNRDGRVVRIVNTAGTILTLCEVQIIGWPVRPPGSCAKTTAQQLSKKLQLAKAQLKRGIRNSRALFTKTVKTIGQRQMKKMPLRRTCEHSVGTIACPKGYTVSIRRAMYGRQSTKFCPRGRLSARTNCAAKKALTIAKSRCRGRQSCQVPARNQVFDDPCPGTFKYLEVSYLCVLQPGQVRNQLKAARNRYQASKRQLMARFRAAKTGLKAKIVTEKRRYKRCLGGMSCDGGKRKALSRAIAKEQQKHKTAVANVQRAKTAGLAGIAGKRLIANPETRTCENHVQTITCPAGYAIKLLSVFYGRKDAKSCPHPQIHTVKCQARNPAVRVRAACDGKQTCKLKSSNSVFGDPCPGTYKYMLVKHSCQMTDAKLKSARAAVDARYRNTVSRLGQQHLARVKSLTAQLNSEVAKHRACVNKRKRARSFTRQLQVTTQILRRRLAQVTAALKRKQRRARNSKAQCAKERKLQNKIVRRSVRLLVKQSKRPAFKPGRAFQKLKRLLIKRRQMRQRAAKRRQRRRIRRRARKARNRQRKARRLIRRSRSKKSGCAQRPRNRAARRAIRRKRRAARRKRRAARRRRRAIRRQRRLLRRKRRVQRRNRRALRRLVRKLKKNKNIKKRKLRSVRRRPRRSTRKNRRRSRKTRRRRRRSAKKNRRRGRKTRRRRRRSAKKNRRRGRKTRRRRRRSAKKNRRRGRKTRRRRRRSAKKNRRRGRKTRRRRRRSAKKNRRRGRKTRRRRSTNNRGSRNQSSSIGSSSSSSSQLSSTGFASSKDMLKFFGDSLGISETEECFTISSEKDVALWRNVQNLLQKSLETVGSRDFSEAEKRNFVSSVNAKLAIAKKKYEAAVRGVRVCVPKQSGQLECLQDLLGNVSSGASKSAAQNKSSAKSSRKVRSATRKFRSTSRSVQRRSRRARKNSRRSVRRQIKRRSRKARRASRRARRRARKARRVSKKSVRRQVRRRARKNRRASRRVRRASRRARRRARKARRVSKRSYRRKARRGSKKGGIRIKRKLRRGMKVLRRTIRRQLRREKRKMLRRGRRIVQRQLLRKSSRRTMARRISRRLRSKSRSVRRRARRTVERWLTRRLSRVSASRVPRRRKVKKRSAKKTHKRTRMVLQ